MQISRRVLTIYHIVMMIVTSTYVVVVVAQHSPSRSLFQSAFNESEPMNSSSVFRRTISVSSDKLVRHVRIQLSLSHSSLKDVSISLVHNNLSVLLLDRPSKFTTLYRSCYDIFRNITFDDNAYVSAQNICSDDDKHVSFFPLEALDIFHGNLVNGDWTLYIVDERDTDYGEILWWALDFDLYAVADVSVPTSPSNLRYVYLGAFAVEVIWTSPISDGGFPIRFYSVTVANVTTITYVKTNRWVISPVNPDTDYFVSVSAANIIGISLPSNILYVHTSTACGEQRVVYRRIVEMSSDRYSFNVPELSISDGFRARVASVGVLFRSDRMSSFRMNATLSRNLTTDPLNSAIDIDLIRDMSVLIFSYSRLCSVFDFSEILIDNEGAVSQDYLCGQRHVVAHARPHTSLLRFVGCDAVGEWIVDLNEFKKTKSSWLELELHLRVIVDTTFLAVQMNPPVVLVVNAFSVSVSWKPIMPQMPIIVRGGNDFTPQRYVVFYTQKFGIRTNITTTPISRHNITISPLWPDTAYYVSVAVQNLLGIGPRSSEMEVKTAAIDAKAAMPYQLSISGLFAIAPSIPVRFSLTPPNWISSIARVAKVRLYLDIVHPFANELRIDIFRFPIDVVALYHQPESDSKCASDIFKGVWLDDNAQISIQDACGDNINGNFKPMKPFSSFQGLFAGKGSLDWHIVVTDQHFSAFGWLLDWALEVTVTMNQDDMISPAIPSGLHAVILEPFAATLKWTSSEHARNYIVSFRPSYETGSDHWIELPPVSDTTITIFSLRADTLYDFFVTAANLVDKSDAAVLQESTPPLSPVKSATYTMKWFGGVNGVSQVIQNSLALVRTVYMTVPDLVTMGLSVKLSFRHDSISDLVIILEHGDINITLIKGPLLNSTSHCGPGEYINVPLRDGPLSMSSIQSICSPSVGSEYRPYDEFSNFFGVDPFGAWTFYITDVSRDHTGVLFNFSVAINVSADRSPTSTIDLAPTLSNLTPFSVTLSWGESHNAQMYKVEHYRASIDFFRQERSVTAPHISVHLLPLLPNCTYLARVAAWSRAGGYASFSPFVTIHTPSSSSPTSNYIFREAVFAPLTIGRYPVSASVIRMPALQATLSNVEIVLRLSHQHPSRLSMVLKHDDMRITLMQRPRYDDRLGIDGQCDAIYHEQFQLADDAKNLINDHCLDFGDYFRPIEALSKFTGRQISGDWTLELSDIDLNDDGVLHFWMLNLNVTLENPPSLEAPTSISSVSTSPTKATIEWHDAESNRFPVDCYILRYRARSDSDWIYEISSSMSNDIDIQYLFPGNEYYAQVSSVSSLGQSPWSNFTQFVTLPGIGYQTFGALYNGMHHLLSDNDDTHFNMVFDVPVKKAHILNLVVNISLNHVRLEDMELRISHGNKTAVVFSYPSTGTACSTFAFLDLTIGTEGYTKFSCNSIEENNDSIYDTYWTSEPLNIFLGADTFGNWNVSLYLKENEHFNDGLLLGLSFRFNVTFDDILLTPPMSPDLIIVAREIYSLSFRISEPTMASIDVPPKFYMILYRVIYSLEWEYLKVPATASSEIRLDSLLIHTTYELKALATNVFGDSPVSSSVFTKTLEWSDVTKPSSPVHFRVVTVSALMATLEWLAPENNGGALIIGYEVWYRVLDNSGGWTFHLIKDASVRSFTAELLFPNTMYNFRTRAINTRTQSDWVEITLTTRISLGFEAFTVKFTGRLPLSHIEPVFSKVTAPFSGVIERVDVWLRFRQAVLSDLIVSLSHHGITVTLFHRPLLNRVTESFCELKYEGIWLSDGAPLGIQDICVPEDAGSYFPLEPLQHFSGRDIEGLWVLNLTDSAPKDDVLLFEWGIMISAYNVHRSGPRVPDIPSVNWKFSSKTSVALLIESQYLGSTPMEMYNVSYGMLIEENKISEVTHVRSFPGTTSLAVITGLNSGSTYWFFVTPINKNGAGERTAELLANTYSSTALLSIKVTLQVNDITISGQYFKLIVARTLGVDSTSLNVIRSEVVTKSSIAFYFNTSLPSDYYFGLHDVLIDLRTKYLEGFFSFHGEIVILKMELWVDCACSEEGVFSCDRMTGSCICDDECSRILSSRTNNNNNNNIVMVVVSLVGFPIFIIFFFIIRRVIRRLAYVHYNGNESAPQHHPSDDVSSTTTTRSGDAGNRHISSFLASHEDSSLSSDLSISVPTMPRRCHGEDTQLARSMMSISEANCPKAEDSFELVCLKLT